MNALAQSSEGQLLSALVEIHCAVVQPTGCCGVHDKQRLVAILDGRIAWTLLIQDYFESFLRITTEPKADVVASIEICEDLSQVFSASVCDLKHVMALDFECPFRPSCRLLGLL
jgi:hypothetical protein